MRVRKPEALVSKGKTIAHISRDGQGIIMCRIRVEFAELKRLWAWQGRVLNWMEHKAEIARYKAAIKGMK